MKQTNGNQRNGVLMKAIKKNETPEMLAFGHSMDLVFSFMDEAERQGLSNSDLANRMGISKSRLSNILAAAQNMTLKTIAKFECALGVRVDFGLTKAASSVFVSQNGGTVFEYARILFEKKAEHESVSVVVNPCAKEESAMAANGYEVAA